jgi:DNA polymerase (family X)
MDNSKIADMFSLLGKMIDVHGESSFKSKAYANAAFQIDNMPEQITNMPTERIASLKGIGDAIAAKIQEILATGQMQTLNKYLQKTPPGVIEMLSIKGLGPKKINTIWQQMEIESVGELLYACNENRLTLFKGFGEKTQENVKVAIQFYLKSQGSFLYQQIEKLNEQLLQSLQKSLAPDRIFMVGQAAMHEDVIDNLEYVTESSAHNISKLLSSLGITFTQEENNFSFQLEEGVNVSILAVPSVELLSHVFNRTCDTAFKEAFEKNFSKEKIENFRSVEEYLASYNLSGLTPDIRRGSKIVTLCKEEKLPTLITTKNIKGIIHTHSDWSDGGNSVEEMAVAAQKQGFEYLVMSDHSKSAFYANGLQEERVKAQHIYIDELNKKLAPFKIFKSIESDILNDGQLDYSNNLLSTFDLVIASVHSNLKMTEEKAMQRLLTAIENPYTTILGHITGRLLLSRAGYPVDHKKIIDACAANHVVIELNAHPRRLDIDWHWLEYALEKGVLISIDPDSHSIAGYHDIHYGVLAARKGLLTPQNNLSSFGLEEFESYLLKIKKLKGI